MNRKEQLVFTRIEAENFRLKEANSKHMDVYRNQSIELIDLKIKVDMVNRLLTELLNEVAL